MVALPPAARVDNVGPVADAAALSSWCRTAEPATQGRRAGASGGTRMVANEKTGGDQTTVAHIVYLLYAIGIIVGVTPIAGVIVAHTKVGQSSGILRSHYQWLIRTFWFTLLGWLVGMALMFMYIGWIVWLVVIVWYIYRVAKGWLRLNDGKAIENVTGLF